jgi:PAS domain S-box-containing protein
MLICDGKGRIRRANLRMEKLYGYSRRELLDSTVEALMPLRQQEESSALRLRYLAESDGLEGVHSLDLDNSFDRYGKRKDGGEFLLEVRASPVRLDGSASLLMLHRDITERYKAEQRFRALLESAPDAMVISNSKGLIELVNRETERLFGYAREDLMGQPVEMLIPRCLRENYRQDIGTFFAGGEMKPMDAGGELRALRKDGKEIPVEINFSPLEGPSGTLMMAAIRDTTGRRKAAALLEEKMRELRNSNEELEQFAYIASHDLQEPLRMVASYTQLLARRYKGRLDADADEFIHYAVDGTQRMKRLIEDLLIYSRAGKSVPELTEVSADRALDQALRSLQESITESGARVVRGNLPRVLTSEGQLEQVFQNLIGNAIKYRNERAPEIRITARDIENEWIFSVADNGIGIDPQYFERIFLVFQRLHGRREYEGTGIGLAICKRMLLRMGGRIWVESEPGQGATFFFSLPKG